MMKLILTIAMLMWSIVAVAGTDVKTPGGLLSPGHIPQQLFYFLFFVGAAMMAWAVISWFKMAFDHVRSRGTSMLPVIGMIISAICLAGFMAWYFIQNPVTHDLEQSSVQPTSPAASSTSQGATAIAIAGNHNVITLPQPAASPHATPPQVTTQRPAFALSDEAKIGVKGSIIEGNPMGIVQGSGKSSVTFEDSVIIGTKPGDKVVFPAPTGEYSKETNDSLRAQVRDLAPKLRALQKEADGSSSEEWITNHENAKAKFNAEYQQHALSLASELLARVGPIERAPLPLTVRLGIDALRLGKLTGHAPISGVADFLELMASKLPT